VSTASSTQIGNGASDIDDDGVADLVVGLPGYGVSGGIDVHGSSSGAHAIAGSQFPGLGRRRRSGRPSSSWT